VDKKGRRRGGQGGGHRVPSREMEKKNWMGEKKKNKGKVKKRRGEIPERSTSGVAETQTWGKTSNDLRGGGKSGGGLTKSI